MSNFSNIGFSVSTFEELQQLLEKVHGISRQIKVNEGSYLVYTDGSGAELFIQFNKQNTNIGTNPHFKGKSKRTVCLTNIIERAESEFEGAFHCWAAPTEADNPSGAYPFIFDVPDFKTIGHIDLPKNFDIQLAAFAHDISVYDSEKEYYDNHTQQEGQLAAQAFIPTGLFSSEEESKNNKPPPALCVFSGVIKQFERKRNGLTNEEFYWLLVDTLGGEVDVVADIPFFEKEPVADGIIIGAFWLSGQLINPPVRELKESKTFFQRLFGR